MRILFHITITLWAASLFAGSGETFTVKPNSRVTLDNVAGNIHVHQARGDKIRIEYNLASENDTVDVEEKDGHIQIDAGNTFTGLGATDFNIYIPKRKPNAAHIKLTLLTVSGVITVNDIEADARVRTVSGSIEISNFNGNLKASSLSGSVRLSGIGNAVVDADAVSGTVIMEKSALRKGKYKLNTTSGNIRLSYPAAASFQLRGSTLSGSVRDSDKQFDVKFSAYVNSKTVKGKVGKGDAAVDLTTISGDLYLRKQASK